VAALPCGSVEPAFFQTTKNFLESEDTKVKHSFRLHGRQKLGRRAFDIAYLSAVGRKTLLIGSLWIPGIWSRGGN